MEKVCETFELLNMRVVHFWIDPPSTNHEPPTGSLVWEICENHDGAQQFYGCALQDLWGVGRENQNLIRVLKNQCETFELLNIRVGSIFEKGVGVQLKKTDWESGFKKGLGVRF